MYGNKKVFNWFVLGVSGPGRFRGFIKSPEPLRISGIVGDFEKKISGTAPLIGPVLIGFGSVRSGYSVPMGGLVRSGVDRLFGYFNIF